MSQEITKYFTQEEFTKHLRFLTSKEDFESKINETKSLTNLYPKKDKILNTADLDAKFEEYLKEGTELVDYIYASCGAYINLAPVLAVHQGGIQFCAVEPENKDPSTFYVTPQHFETNGELLNYTTDYDGVQCHYFYTGSIEEGSDKGLMVFANGMYTVMEGNPQEQIRYMLVMNPAEKITTIFRTELKGSGGAFRNLPNKVQVNKSKRGFGYFKDGIAQSREGLGFEPRFSVMRSPDDSFLYGDFHFGETGALEYSRRAVEVTFKDPERKIIRGKTAGEYVHGFFSKGYSYAEGEDKLSQFEQIQPGKFTKLISYEPNKVYRTYQLTPADLQKYNLGQINNFGPENLPELTLNCYIHSDPADPSGQRLASQGLSLFHGLVYLDFVEVIHGINFHAMMSIDSDELDFKKIKQEAVEIQKRSETTGQFGIRIRGLVINDRNPNLIVRYEGQSIDKYFHGQGCMTYGGQIKSEGTFKFNNFVEGEMTYLKDALVRMGSLGAGMGGDDPMKLIGKFTNNQLNDPNGKILFVDGSVYEGPVEASLPKGQGRLVFGNGDVYEGEFMVGSMHGQGKMTYVGGDVYTGEFSGQMIYGEGELRRANGDVYTGKVAQDKINGTILTIKGRLVRSDGSEAQGSFTVNLEDGGGEGGAGGSGIGGGSAGGSGGATLGMMRLEGLWNPLLLTSAFSQHLESSGALFVDGFSAENRTMKALESTSALSRFREKFGKDSGLSQTMKGVRQKVAFPASRKTLSMNLKARMLPKPTVLVKMMKRILA